MPHKSFTKPLQKVGLYLVLSLLVLLIISFCFGLYMIWRTSAGYREEAKVSASMEQYKPRPQQETADGSENDDGLTAKNPSLTEAQQLNGDVVAWLELDGTKIDYIVVKGKDNREYLRHDIYGNYSTAGTVFEDYRCSPDFTDTNTVVYGHNMKNGKMFSNLSKYGDKTFFSQSAGGFLYLSEMSCRLEVFAFLTVKSDDSVIYNTSLTADGVDEYLAYVKKNAVNYRDDISVAPGDNILTLSTCSYSFEGARNVALAKIVRPVNS